MFWVDHLLNLACLLLWLAWASRRIDFPPRGAGSSPLATTLRRAGPARAGHWGVLLALPAVLVVRAWFYWYVGPALEWRPAVDFGVTRLPFQTVLFPRALVYSVLSFGQVWAGAYVWLLLLAVVNYPRRDTDPMQRAVHQLLGWVGRAPRVVLALLGPALATLVWVGLQPVLVWCQTVPAGALPDRVAIQGLLVWAALLLTAKYLVAVVMVGHLINSYAYLGNQPVWSFLSATATAMLRPLRKLPLRVRRFDAAPLVALALVFLLANFASDWLRQVQNAIPTSVPRRKPAGQVQGLRPTAAPSQPARSPAGPPR